MHSGELKDIDVLLLILKVMLILQIELLRFKIKLVFEGCPLEVLFEVVYRFEARDDLGRIIYD